MLLNRGTLLAVLIILILALVALIISLLVNLLFTPFYTTPKNIIKEILKIINLQPHDTFVDLGSGDGRMVIEAGKNKKINAIGYELSPLFIEIARLNKLFKVGLAKNITFELENVFTSPLSSNNIIYTYLEPPALEKLRDKIKKIDGIKFYSYEYAIPDFKPTNVWTLSNNKKLYYYNINSKTRKDDTERKKYINRKSSK